MIDLFVYGTLLCPEIWALVVGPRPTREAARLAGYRRAPVRGEVYPGIVPAGPESFVDGAVHRGLAPALVAALDVYEGAMYRRERVRVRLGDGATIDAEVYVIDDAFVGCVDGDAWSLEVFRDRHLERFVAALRAERERGGPAIASGLVPEREIAPAPGSGTSGSSAADP